MYNKLVYLQHIYIYIRVIGAHYYKLGVDRTVCVANPTQVCITSGESGRETFEDKIAGLLPCDD